MIINTNVPMNEFHTDSYVDLVTLQNTLKEGIKRIIPNSVRVCAEVSSVSRKPNGHCYIEMSQTENGRLLAKARAIIWRTTYERLMPRFYQVNNSELRPGMKVLVDVKANYHEVYGLSFYIDNINPEFTLKSTLGERELERRRTIEKLTKEGLIDLQKQLERPVLPYKLAVISANGAAGLGDFLRHIGNNEYGFVFSPVLFPSVMQGAGSPPSICAALAEINDAYQYDEHAYDAILILRGGGSELDLACFDDYEMAKSIALSNFPVYTAIGHDRDFHVADMVASAHFKTPTALADELISCFMSEDERLSTYSSRLQIAFLNKVSKKESKIDLLESRINNGLQRKVLGMESNLNILTQRIKNVLYQRLNLMDSSINMLESRIKSADPRGILKRGYVLTLSPSGAVMKKATDTKKGDNVRIMFADGVIHATVDDVEVKKVEVK